MIPLLPGLLLSLGVEYVMFVTVARDYIDGSVVLFSLAATVFFVIGLLGIFTNVLLVASSSWAVYLALLAFAVVPPLWIRARGVAITALVAGAILVVVFLAGRGS